MATSFVQWDGLTKLIMDLKRVPRQADIKIGGFTRTLGQDVLDQYRINLSGSVPSTDADLLPVGIVTADLITQATLTVHNQYSFDVHNDSDHAGWIEDGTYKMDARQPLGNAVMGLEQDMDVSLPEVMVGIIEG